MQDSHAHYITPQDMNDAARCGVKQACLVGTRFEDAEDLWKRVQSSSSVQVTGFVGFHPWEVAESFDDPVALRQSKDQLETVIRKSKQAGHRVGVGELGLDFAKDRLKLASAQRKACEMQIRVAVEMHLPVQAHVVGAHGDFLKIWDQTVGVSFQPWHLVHAWSGSTELGREYVKRGFLLGIGGLVLDSKNQKLRKCVQDLPLSSLRIESEWPGRPLQVQILDEIVQFLCETKGATKEQVIQATTDLWK